MSWVDSDNLNVKLSLKEKGFDNANQFELAVPYGVVCVDVN